jgi:hypothetical protein
MSDRDRVSRDVTGQAHNEVRNESASVDDHMRNLQAPEQGDVMRFLDKLNEQTKKKKQKRDEAKLPSPAFTEQKTQEGRGVDRVKRHTHEGVVESNMKRSTHEGVVEASSEKREERKTVKLSAAAVELDVYLNPVNQFMPSFMQNFSYDDSPRVAARAFTQFRNQIIKLVRIHEAALNGQQEVNLHMKDSLLAGSDVQIRKNGKVLEIVFVLPHSDMATIIAQYHGSLEEQLARRLHNIKEVTVRAILMEQKERPVSEDDTFGSETGDEDTDESAQSDVVEPVTADVEPSDEVPAIEGVAGHEINESADGVSATPADVAVPTEEEDSDRTSTDVVPVASGEIEEQAFEESADAVLPGESLSEPAAQEEDYASAIVLPENVSEVENEDAVGVSQDEVMPAGSIDDNVEQATEGADYAA